MSGYSTLTTIVIQDSTKAKEYLVTINGDPHVFAQPHVTGKDILNKVSGREHSNYVVYQLLDEADIKVVDNQQKVNLAEPDFERFVVKESATYSYLVDNDPEMSDKKVLTAGEVLSKAAYKPEEYYLVEIHENGQQTSFQHRAHDNITLTHHPKKRFISIYQGSMPVS